MHPINSNTGVTKYRFNNIKVKFTSASDINEHNDFKEVLNLNDTVLT